jgi:hypothetical protein
MSAALQYEFFSAPSTPDRPTVAINAHPAGGIEYFAQPIPVHHDDGIEVMEVPVVEVSDDEDEDDDVVYMGQQPAAAAWALERQHGVMYAPPIDIVPGGAAAAALQEDADLAEAGEILMSFLEGGVRVHQIV